MITQVTARSAGSLALVLAFATSGCGMLPDATRATPANPATSGPSQRPSQNVSPPAAAIDVESAYEQVIKRVLPSIVQITTGNDLGSGIVFDTQGHIVTNAHVVGDAREFQVTVATGGQARHATLVGTYPAGDLAVIKVGDADGLAPALFADSAAVRVGQMVLAMGNPLGLSGTVTQGIVSALGRTVTGQYDDGRPGGTIADAIQTSAAINRGNSGGALVDLSGQVVGIPTLGASDQAGSVDGIGFAIPSTTASDIAQQLIKDGRVVNSHRAALGVRVGTAIGENGEPIGVVVSTVAAGSGAAKAGIRPGDVIVSVNGAPTPTTTALSEVLAGLSPRKQVKVELLDENGRVHAVTVTLGELPS
ncbi:protease [Acrocarpospora phusangensis]|uniref:Protease n=1 Tax=Acrocarpospora phusangensis TaxID=1070424 RepID=A0A919QIX9_9ACTN|nr:protease [Acrocarpospora phusangensis]